MASICVYIAAHKPYQAAEDGAYRMIQVGSANPPFTDCRDNLGEDHISHKNPSFCELTALYWIWKHAEADVLGLVHYRRYFAGQAGKDPWQRIASGQALLEALEGVDMVLPKKRHYVIETNYSQYAHAHHEKDLIALRELLGQQCPEYVPAYDAVMQRRSGHRFNMMVMRRELLDEYCSWLFPLLFELERRIDTSGYDAYNSRVIGFLAERLLDVWMEYRGVSCRELPVVNMESENWPKKGFNFIKRKVLGTLTGRSGGRTS